MSEDTKTRQKVRRYQDVTKEQKIPRRDKMSEDAKT